MFVINTLESIGNKSTEKNSVKCIWGDAFESIKSVEDDTYDHIFVDLNDDQFCIDLAAKNMDSMIRILKPNGVITAQVGSQDKKPEQVDRWLDVFQPAFWKYNLWIGFTYQVLTVLGTFHHQLIIKNFFLNSQICEINLS